MIVDQVTRLVRASSLSVIPTSMKCKWLDGLSGLLPMTCKPPSFVRSTSLAVRWLYHSVGSNCVRAVSSATAVGQPWFQRSLCGARCRDQNGILDECPSSPGASFGNSAKRKVRVPRQPVTDADNAVCGAGRVVMQTNDETYRWPGFRGSETGVRTLLDSDVTMARTRQADRQNQRSWWSSQGALGWVSR